MKSWNVYLPNGEAVAVIGEIECRDGKFYFTYGDDVVAVFNEDKVCGVNGEYTPRQNDVENLEKYRELLMAVSRKHPNESRHETALRYIKEAEHVEIIPEPKSVFPPTAYPTGKEG